MPRRRSSTTQDISQIATGLLEEAVGEPAPITPVGKKNPAAMDPGSAGGLKSAAARARPERAKGLSLKKQKT